jgi:hypothetical protein
MLGPVRDTRLPGDREVAHRAGEVTAVEGTEREGRRRLPGALECLLELFHVHRCQRRTVPLPVVLSRTHQMRQFARPRARLCAETAAYSL